MAQKTINATQENRIISSAATTAYSGQSSVGENKDSVQVQRAFAQIPFTNIPAGSTITAVTLSWYNNDSSLASNTRTMRVYRMIQAWTSSCTWNTYNGSDAWGTAGASNTSTDREATDIGSASVAHDLSAGYVEISLTAASVQEMFTGAFTNNGIHLKMDTEDADLHDGSPGAYPTKWAITYTPPASMFIMF